MVAVYLATTGADTWLVDRLCHATFRYI